MPTRPTSPDPSGSNASSNPFAGLGAGLDFFQDWVKAAGSALPNLQGSTTQAGALPAWSMPTLDPEELDKRIQDLRTVQFWLEQNARMIAMTIQGLEVQKMTLSTLKGMNVSMDAVRDALRARAGNAEAPAEPPQSAAAPPPRAADPGPDRPDQPDATAAQADLINPMRWWDTLTQQFTHLASQTAQTAQTMGETMMGDKAGKPAASGKRRPARKATTARKSAAKARSAGKSNGSDTA